MLKPLGNRILVKLEKNEEKTRSGIIVGKHLDDKIQYVKVCEIGENNNSEDDIIIEIEKNDIVVIDKYLGVEIIFENEEYLIINKEDIYRYYNLK